MSLLSLLPPENTPKKKYTEEELFKFSNWIPSGDNKQMASDLSRRGLQNATQLFLDSPDTKTFNGLRNAQSDWKPAAIQQILMRAKMAGIKDETEMLANKSYLTNGRFKEALNHEVFNQIHPNFWKVVSSIYKDQLSKESVPDKGLATIKKK